MLEKFNKVDDCGFESYCENLPILEELLRDCNLVISDVNLSNSYYKSGLIGDDGFDVSKIGQFILYRYGYNMYQVKHLLTHNVYSLNEFFVFRNSVISQIDSYNNFIGGN